MSASAFDPRNAPPTIPQVGERTFRFEFSDATHHTACAVEFAREGVVVRHFYNASLVSTRYIPWDQIERLSSLPSAARETFLDQSDHVLEQLADATHREPAEVIDDALSVYWWHAREQSAGTAILALRRGQHMAASIVLPSLAGMDPLPAPVSEEPPTNSPRDNGDGGWPVEPLGFAPPA